ncbi:CHAP domain-containing protein, partial [Nonomuraea sp. RK-328]|nr:CHAP domain-containing protein [Nonomuraea sp. RK-328]
MTKTRDRVLDVARSQLGTGERADGTSKYGSWYERAKPAPGFAVGAWCQMFLSWCANEVGLPETAFPRLAYTPYAVKWFKDRSRWGTKPKVGALVYYNFPGGDFVDHVEIVEAVRSDGSIVTIGGNVGNRVQRLVRRSNIYGYGYPDYGSTEDDMPSAKEIADAVYERFTHEVTAEVWAAREKILEPGQKVDPRTAFRQIWAYTKDGYAKDREILARLEAQMATIKALADALAERNENLDADALIDRIRTQLDNVSINLEVGK